MKKALILIVLLVGAILITGCESDRARNNNGGDINVIKLRKDSYADTLTAYIDSVRTKVNEARKLRFFETQTLFFVPNTCAEIESGGRSPFSDKWEYAYVAVQYTADLYSYYAVALDGAGYGIKILPQIEINKNLGAVVQDPGSITKVNEFYDNYNIDENKTINAVDFSKELKEALDSSNIKVSKVVFISSNSCSYQR